MNRKDRRKELLPTRIHAKFIYSEKQELPVKFVDKPDGRKIAYVTVEWYASTKAKDGMGDIVKPEGINLSRFEAGNAPLKAMHGRDVLSNVGVILSARVDWLGLYMKAEARLDITKDNHGRPINQEDYVLYDRLTNRTINGFSVGFHDITEWYDEELKANVIHSMTLHEVSLVDIPANPLTIVKMLEVHKQHQDLSSDNNMPDTNENVEIETEEVTPETSEEGVQTEEVKEEEKEMGTTEEIQVASESQEPEVIWNDDGQPEQGEADEGEKILWLTKSLETQVKTIGELEAKVKELEDGKAEVEKENEVLKTDLDEAQKAYFAVEEAYKGELKKVETAIKTIEAIRWIKVEHGLKQMEDQEVKKGNVAVAFEDAIKQL